MQLAKLKLALVDDHQIVIDGLKSMLKNNPRYEVVIECNHPEKMMDLLKMQIVDILLTDIMMPGMDGVELAKAVKKSYPSIKIMALSMNGEGVLIHRMIEEAGISGYVLKNIGQSEFLHALDKIAEGGVYFSEEVMKEMINYSAIQKKQEAIHLTSREIEIIRLIERELSNRQIAELLCLSERTVETHRKNIFRKTGTNSVLGLIKFAYEHKLI